MRRSNVRRPQITVTSTETITQFNNRRRYLFLLWTCLFALVLADGLITEYLIAQRFAWEFNPILVGLVGDSGFLLLKALGALLVILVLWDIAKRNYRLALTFTFLSVIFYSSIVYWNLFVVVTGFFKS